MDTILDYTYDVNYSVQKGECLEFSMRKPRSYPFKEFEDLLGARNTIPFEMESVDIDGEGRIYHTSTSGFKYDCYLKDHLGSTRMVVNDENVVTEAFAYQPYGTIIPLEDVAATPQTPTRQQFTGKEFDTEGEDSENGVVGIQAYHFGARVYDPELGIWFSIDPAGQFLNLYGYTTNPIVFIDENGESFSLAAVLIGAAIGAGVGGATYSIQAASTGNWNFGDFMMQTVLGGIGGAITGGVGSLGTSVGTNMFYSAIGNFASYGLTSTISGQEMSMGGVGAALIGGLAGGLMPTYAGLNNLTNGVLAKNAALSIVGEISYGAAKGALMGGITATIQTGDIGNFGKGAAMGSMTGAIGTGLMMAHSGRLYNTGYEKQLAKISNGSSSRLYVPGFRKGGINQAIEYKKAPDGKKPGGFFDRRTGRITMLKNDPRYIGHEFKHYMQAIELGPIDFNQQYKYDFNYYEIDADRFGARLMFIVD